MEIVRADEDGRRLFIVVTEGPKWTSLIDYGYLRHLKMETAKFRREMKPEQLDIPHERMLRRLRKRRKWFRKIGQSYSPVVDNLLKEESNG